MATISDVQEVEKSTSNTVNALLGDGMASWNYLTPSQGNVLYYTFDNYPSFHGTLVTDVQVFNSAQKSAARQLLAHAASVTGVAFTETSDSSLVDIGFYYADIDGATTSGLTATSWQYSNMGQTLTAYDATAMVYLDNLEFSSSNAAPVAGGQGYETLLHELGHALGLKHPFEGTYQLPASLDNTNYTVMSYTDAGGYKSEFQSIDQDALWWIYGGDGLGGTYGINSSLGPTLDRNTATPDTPQADIFLYANSTFAFGTSANVYGAVGQEAVLIEGTANSLTIDQNVDQVELSGSTTDYTYLQAGNQLKVYISGVNVSTIAVGGSGTDIVFSNGTAQLSLSAGIMTLGGSTVSSTTAGSLSIADINTVNTSRAGTIPGETTSQAGVFMKAGGSFILGSASEVYGSSGSETVLVHNGARSITIDQNVERLDLARSAQDLTFQQSGNQVLIYDGGQLSVRVAVQADGTDIAFTNGLAVANLSAGQMTLGGTALSSATPGGITPVTMDAGQTSGISARMYGDADESGSTISILGQADALYTGDLV